MKRYECSKLDQGVVLIAMRYYIKYYVTCTKDIKGSEVARLRMLKLWSQLSTLGQLDYQKEFFKTNCTIL